MAQPVSAYTYEDSTAIENVFVEKYYISNEIDAKDTSGGYLAPGSVTYRIFLDLRPDYAIQMVYGDENNLLKIKTSTYFYNNRDCLAATGFNVDPKAIHIGNRAFDSWITLGAANRVHTGIPLSEDDTVFSFLSHRPEFKKKDGFTFGNMPNFKLYNAPIYPFDSDTNIKELVLNDGCWAAYGGVWGPNETNKILIGQFTTQGEFSFSINVQVAHPNGQVMKFVSGTATKSKEIPLPKLNYNSNKL